MLSYTKLAKQSAVCTQSTLMVKVPLMCSVIKKQPEGGGQCSKRDWTARFPFDRYWDDYKPIAFFALLVAVAVTVVVAQAPYCCDLVILLP